jgi:hypothetical protein
VRGEAWQATTRPAPGDGVVGEGTVTGVVVVGLVTGTVGGVVGVVSSSSLLRRTAPPPMTAAAATPPAMTPVEMPPPTNPGGIAGKTAAGPVAERGAILVLHSASLPTTIGAYSGVRPVPLPWTSM